MFELLNALHQQTCLPRRDALGLVTPRQLRTAVADGVLVRPARGHYALARGVHDLALAKARRAVLSHASAAQFHGLDLLHQPKRTHLTVPRGRNVHDPAVQPHWTQRRLRGHVTDVLDTVLDCARTMPFREALVVADSALRSGLVGTEELGRAAERLSGRGAQMARRVARWASALSGSALETLTRAVFIEGGVTGWVEQHVIADEAFFARADFAFPRLRLVVEADSYRYHGGPQEFAADCRRYNGYVRLGWKVIRVTWADVQDGRELVDLIRGLAVRSDDRRGTRRPRGAPGGSRRSSVGLP